MTADRDPERAPERAKTPAQSVAPAVSWSKKDKKRGGKGKNAKARTAAAKLELPAIPEMKRTVSAAPDLNFAAPGGSTPAELLVAPLEPAKQASSALAAPLAGKAQGSPQPEAPPASTKPSENEGGSPHSGDAEHSIGREFDIAAENLAKFVDQGRRVLAAAMSAN